VVEWDVTLDTETLLVELTGRLMLTDVVALRNLLLKCLTEPSEALLIDMSGMTVGDPLALSVFPAVARQAARWPGIPVLFCAPPPQTRALLISGAYRRLPLFATPGAARAAAGVDRRALLSLSDDLLPVSGAARQARNMATEACLGWALPDLVAPACLIASELVTNVVDHAHTTMTLRLSLRQRYLHLAVRDGSPAAPTLYPDRPVDAEGGRGLLLVSQTAQSWGWLPSESGKVVWATLAA
jgi:anti-anti-sigma regulatory factor